MEKVKQRMNDTASENPPEVFIWYTESRLLNKRFKKSSETYDHNTQAVFEMLNVLHINLLQ